MNTPNDSPDIESTLNWAHTQGTAHYQGSQLGPSAATDAALGTADIGTAPAELRRRVRRARTRRTIGQGTVAVIVAGAIGWGALTLGPSLEGPEPAAPTARANSSVSANESADANPVLYELSAAKLIATARPRSASEPPRTLAETALVCDWDDGTNPRTEPEPDAPGNSHTVSNCDSVWVADDQLINESSALGVRRTPDGNGITVWWNFQNSTEYPLVVDRASVSVSLQAPFGELPTPDSSTPDVTGLNIAADTLWSSPTQRITVSGREVDLVTLKPGEELEGTATFTATLDDDEDTLIDRIVRDDMRFTPLASIRVAPFASDNQDLRLVIGSHRYSITQGDSSTT